MNRRDQQILLITTAVGIIALFFLSIIQNEITEVISIRGNTLWILAIALVLLIILIEIIALKYKNKLIAKQIRSKETLIDEECGLEPLRLENERFYLSATLGSYFASLLESDETYTFVRGQIEYPMASLGFESNPFQAIASSLVDRNGVRILIIAADGGMGKSTLTARLVRCLYSSGEIDRILGDSAKTETIDLRSGEKVYQQPGFTDKKTLYEKLAIQVGMTKQLATKTATVGFLKDALAPYKSLIILDNLETVEDANNVLESLKPLVGKSLRLIVTTREMPTNINHPKMSVVKLNPISSIDDMRDFINWHIQYYQSRIPDLKNIKSKLGKRNIALLIEKSGGVPLIAQLLLSDIASKSWRILEEFPTLVPTQTLEYLYRNRWADLQGEDKVVQLAKKVLIFVASKQEFRQRVNMTLLTKQFGGSTHLLDAIGYLQDKFLLINRNTKSGEFVVYPSLMSYIESQVELSSE